MAVLILMWCGYALLAEARAGAGILYVDDTASGAGDGSSWCDAYVHLQDALAAATVPGSAIAEIRVAEGLYRPDQGIAQNPGDRWATFQLHNAIALRGGYAGCGAGDPDDRDIGAYETVLSGDLAQDDGPGFVNYDENAYTVVAGSGTDATAVLDGFTISGGCANGEGGGAADSGAGMYNDTGSPTIIDCTFVHNVATQYGGGMGNRFDANPMITNCRFIGNVTFYRGGAMSVNRGSPKLFNCMFTGNSAYEGGAVSAFWADVELTNCTMVGNVAYDGGGLAAQIGGDECVAPIVRNSIFWANSATSEPEASSQVYSDPSGACPGATPTIEYT
ncbi:MAG: right-handed parallel beta-helix repeat-containing protein, partial [Phycisphaerae bacterium]